MSKIKIRGVLNEFAEDENVLMLIGIQEKKGLTDDRVCDILDLYHGPGKINTNIIKIYTIEETDG